MYWNEHAAFMAGCEAGADAQMDAVFGDIPKTVIR